MRRWFRELVKHWFNLYDISELTVGAHCGCCGRWVADEIVPEYWAITICEECLKEK